MPTPCWLKHLCSIRAWVPVSFFLSILSVFLSLSVSLFLANSLEPEARWPHFLARASKTLSRRHTAFTHSRGRLVPTCSSASSKNRALLAFRINQGISASFSILLSYRRLQTTRFRSIKGPTLCVSFYCHNQTVFFCLSVLSWITGSLLNSSLSFLFSLFRAALHDMELVPQPEVEPVLIALEACSLNHWTTKEVLAPHCFNSCGCVVRWGSVMPPSLLFFLNTALTIWGILWFHMNSTIFSCLFFCYFYKNCHLVWYTESVDCILESIATLTVSDIPIHDWAVSMYLCLIPFISTLQTSVHKFRNDIQIP